MPRLLLALTLVLLGLAPDALAQDARRMTTERIRFARGASSAVVSGSLDAGRAVRYLVGVNAGQRLEVDLQNYGEAGAAWVQVYAPGRPIERRYAAPSTDGSRHDLAFWTGQLSRSGDYQVVVYPMPGARRAVYELFVTVR